MNKSESIKSIAQALVKAQAQIKTALKDSENPYFRSKYADLSSVWHAVKPALTINGLCVLQIPSTQFLTPDEVAITGKKQLFYKIKITTMLLHESGEFISGDLTIVPVDNTPHAIGSAITYGRRYALGSFLGVATDEDDDGNRASIIEHKNTVKVEKKTIEVNDKLSKMLKAFEPFTFHKTELEAYLGKPSTSFDETDYDNLKILYRKLKSGEIESKTVLDNINIQPTRRTLQEKFKGDSNNV